MYMYEDISHVKRIVVNLAKWSSLCPLPSCISDTRVQYSWNIMHNFHSSYRRYVLL